MPAVSKGNFDSLSPLRSASSPISLEVLSELGQATTAYLEALPDRLEHARQNYEEALRKFNAAHAPESR